MRNFNIPIIFLIFLFSFSSKAQNIDKILDSLSDVDRQFFKPVIYIDSNRIIVEELEKARKTNKNLFNGLPSTNAAITPNLVWTEHGPKDRSGAIRVLVRDVNQANGKKYWAGAASGGLWFNNDITDPNSSWNMVAGGDAWTSLNISSIVFNPANSLEMYVGTGDYLFDQSFPGAGIYKSSDGGLTFNRLVSTIPSSNSSNSIAYNFQFCNKIAINSLGYIFVNTFNGLQRSLDGGNTWTITWPNLIGNDIEIGSDNIIYASFGNFSNSSLILRSTDIMGNSMTNITPNNSGGRTKLCLANSSITSNQIMYAISTSNTPYTLYKTMNGGSSWTSIILNGSSFSNFYLFPNGFEIVSHPNNPNVLFLGSEKLAKSVDGGINWILSNEYFSSINSILVDQNNSSLLLGNSNGIKYDASSGNINPLSQIVFSNRIKGLRTTDISGFISMPNIINDGTVYGGGFKIGGSLGAIGEVNYNIGGNSYFVDQDNPNLVISGNSLFNANGQYLLNFGNYYTGVSDYDSQNNIFYMITGSTASSTSFQVVNNVGTSNIVTNFSIPININYRNLKVGKSPNTIYVGTGSGKLYKISGIGSSLVYTAIEDNSMLNSGQVSSIEIGDSDNELMVTLQEYYSNSVWYTNNGGTSWITKDEVSFGLPNIPVYDAKFLPSPLGQKSVALATALGVWTSSNILETNPAWTISNTGFPNIKVNKLYFRNSDSLIVAATNGRGYYVAPMRGFLNPSIDLTFNKPLICKAGNLNVDFSFIGNVPAGGTYSVQLSSSTGSFINPTIIGNGSLSPINITIPSATPSGDNYKIRIVSNSNIISNESLNIKIKSANEINLISYINFQSNNGAYIYCPGVSINMSSYISGFNSNAFNYNWSGPNGFIASGSNVTVNNTISLSAGIYTTTTTIETCQTYTTSLNLLATSSITINASGNSTLCPGGTLNLSSNPTILTNSVGSFSWTGPNAFSSTSQNPSISNVTTAASGVYTVTGTYTGTCAGTATATVNVNITSNLPSYSFYSGNNCLGATTNLYTSINSSTSGLVLTYSWTGPDGFSSNIQSPNVTNLTAAKAGVYTSTISYSGTCSGSSTSTVNLTLSGPTIGFSNLANYCPGSNVNIGSFLNANGLTSSFTWTGPNGFSSSGSNLVINNLSSSNLGVYTVTSTYNGSCVGTVSTSITLQFNTPSVFINGNQSYCEGGITSNIAQLSTNSFSATYAWNGPNNFSSIGNTLSITNFNAQKAGSYTVTASYSGACSGTTTAQVLLNDVKPYLNHQSNPKVACLGGNVNLSIFSNVSPLSYTWTGPNGFSSTLNNAQITSLNNNKTGIYSVSIVFGNGCNTTLTSQITVALTPEIPPLNVFQDNNSGEYCVNSGRKYMYISTNNNFNFDNCSVVWTKPDGTTFNSNSINEPLSFFANSSADNGIYSVNVSHPGCINSSTATKNVNVSSTAKSSISIVTNSPQNISNNGNSVSVCEGNYVSLIGSSNGTSTIYNWTGPNLNITNNNFVGLFTPLSTNQSGLYTLTSNSSGTCGGISTSTVQINISNSQIQPPILTISPRNYNLGEMVTLSSNCNSQTYWPFSSSTSTSISLISNPTTYTASCFNSPGCYSLPSNKIEFKSCNSTYNINFNLTNYSTKFESNNTINSYSKISPVSDIIYDAKNSITLSPGFQVDSGSVFKAFIDGCGNN